MAVPAQPKIYHILHVDRLASVLADGKLWSDAMVQTQAMYQQVAGLLVGQSHQPRLEILQQWYY